MADMQLSTHFTNAQNYLYLIVRMASDIFERTARAVRTARMFFERTARAVRTARKFLNARQDVRMTSQSVRTANERLSIQKRLPVRNVFA